MFKTRNLFASNNVQSLIQAENERSTEFLLSLIDRCFLYNLHCFITSRAQPVCSSQFIPLIQSTMFWACTQLWTAISHLKGITDNYETWINEMMFAISLLIAGHTGQWSTYKNTPHNVPTSLSDTHGHYCMGQRCF